MPIPINNTLVTRGEGYYLINAKDVALNEGGLLDYMPEAVTQAKYNELEKDGKLVATKPYLIIKEG